MRTCSAYDDAQSLSATSEVITTPSSFVNAPPASNKEKPSSSRATFRQANRVVALFKDIKSGQYELQPWTKFQLQPGEYDEIERLVLNDTDTSLWGFINNKIRYDFDGDRNQLILRMPTAIHERFVTLVKQDIDAQLKSLATSTTLEESVTHFAQRVCNLGSADIKFPNDTSQKPPQNSPDGTYYYRDAKWPGVILEVSYSEKRKDLEKLADRYILLSKANVRVVVGLDIEYQHPKQKKTKAGSRDAVLSVWRPEIIQNEGKMQLIAAQKIKDQPFRDAQGDPTSSQGLSLLLSEFAHPEISQAITDHDQSINISTDKLCEYLNDAEEMMQRVLDNSLIEMNLPAGVEIKFRENTPPEVLDEEDERKFRMKEK
ncbi:hypothetical protein BDV96DRAFT_569234 [Lophiotrema nucula]|uniref:Uncharacterized protein n=1 Tax=Lophiotrema nucula TaxID=690887 RepID=A0A6A5ZIC9_9PLEO|nr:hypothetical protein BDV96DRAFT_569234 [Lophiotrema nucula]